MEIEIREFCEGFEVDHRFEEIEVGKTWKEAARECAKKTFSEPFSESWDFAKAEFRDKNRNWIVIQKW